MEEPSGSAILTYIDNIFFLFIFSSYFCFLPCVFRATVQPPRSSVPLHTSCWQWQRPGSSCCNRITVLLSLLHKAYFEERKHSKGSVHIPIVVARGGGRGYFHR